MADGQFEQIRVERVKYQKNLKNDISNNKKGFLQKEINLDNLMEYIKWKFPDRRDSERTSAAELLLELHKTGYSKLIEVDEAIDRGYEAAIKAEEEHPFQGKGYFVGVGLIRKTLRMVDTDYNKEYNKKHKITSNQADNNHIEKYKYLIKPALKAKKNSKIKKSA